MTRWRTVHKRRRNKREKAEWSAAADILRRFLITTDKIKLVAAERVRIGDYVCLDQDTGKLRKYIAGEDNRTVFTVPPGAAMTEDGYLLMPAFPGPCLDLINGGELFFVGRVGEPLRTVPAAHVYFDDLDDDPEDEPLDDCSMTSGGQCMQAGSEYCEFECPYRRTWRTCENR